VTDKLFIDPRQLLRDSFALAGAIYDSGYRPEVLLVLWRGGTPVGIVVHEFLLYKGIRTYHAPVKAESYLAIGQSGEPRVEHLDSILGDLAQDSRVLVVDDIFDTGCTVRKIRDLLAHKTRNVRIATLYYKPSRNRTELVPDFFVRETDRWIVFPHELMDLSPEEIRAKDEYIHSLLSDSAAG
jgi:hypoxanthine phosphoribosyltransferase